VPSQAQFEVPRDPCSNRRTGPRPLPPRAASLPLLAHRPSGNYGACFVVGADACRARCGTVHHEGLSAVNRFWFLTRRSAGERSARQTCERFADRVARRGKRSPSWLQECLSASGVACGSLVIFSIVIALSACGGGNGAATARRAALQAECRKVDSSPELRSLPTGLRLFLTPGDEERGRRVITIAVNQLRRMRTTLAAAAAGPLETLITTPLTDATLRDAQRVLAIAGSNVEKQCRS
jgi:hypothetical protein